MSFDSSTDYVKVSRGSVVSFGTDYDPGSAPLDDHARVLAYKIDQVAGSETLTFTSDSFTVLAGSEDFTLESANNTVNNEIGVESGCYYRLAVIWYNAVETQSAQFDEVFVYVFPDFVELFATSGSANSIDIDTLNKALHLLGENVLHGQFVYADGYAQSRVVRGYHSMTETEAAALLAASESPSEDGVEFKSFAQVTTSTDGNETAVIETEESLS